MVEIELTMGKQKARLIVMPGGSTNKHSSEPLLGLIMIPKVFKRDLDVVVGRRKRAAVEQIFKGKFMQSFV